MGTVACKVGVAAKRSLAHGGSSMRYAILAQLPRISRWLLASGVTVLATCEGPTVPVPQPLLLAERGPVWSPGGDSIAYVETDSDGNESIVVVPLDTGDRTSFDVGRGAGALDFAPRSAKVAFSQGFRLYELDLSTGTVTPFGPDALSVWPAYSPDEAQIAFTSDGGENQHPPDLWVVTRAGAINRVPLPFPRGQMSAADWPPDGRYLVSAYHADETPRLFVTDLAARDTAFITPIGVSSLLPAWSPDGEWIAYVRASNGNSGDLHLVRPDGTDDHRIARNSTFPAWSPDGRLLAVNRLLGDRIEAWLMRPDGSEAWPLDRSN